MYHKSLIKIGFLISVIIIFLRFLGVFELLELKAYDRLHQWKANELLEERIVLVTIIEKDVERSGTYPFSDLYWSQLLNNIKKQNPRVIGLDIFRDQPVPPGSLELEKVFNTTDNLIGIIKQTIPPVSASPILKNKNQVGDVSAIADKDGIIRRHFLYPPTTDAIPNFSLKLALTYLGTKDKNNDRNPSLLQIEDVVFPRLRPQSGGYADLRQQYGYQILINWRKPINQFKEVRFFDVIDGKVPSGFFTDKIVIIGVSGESFNDFHSTPFISQEGFLRGIDIHAQVVSQILSAVSDNRGLIHWLPNLIEEFWCFLWIQISIFLVAFYRNFSLKKIVILITSLFFFNTLIAYLALQNNLWLPIIPTLIGVIVSSITSKLIIDNHELIKLNNKTIQSNSSLQKEVEDKIKKISLIEKEKNAQEKLILFQQITNSLKERVAAHLNILENQIKTLHSYTNFSWNELSDYDLKVLQVQTELDLGKIQEKFNRLRIDLGILPNLVDILPNKLFKDIDLKTLLDNTIELIYQNQRKKYDWLKQEIFRISCPVDLTFETNQDFRRDLTWVLLHLLDNSFRAINKKITQPNFYPEIKILISYDQNFLKITVQDNGIGMNPEQVKNSMEPFTSFVNDNENDSRIGMGLNQCQKILEIYKGFLGLDSVEGEKTTVELNFPYPLS